jgi:HEAT repeat protein
VRRATTTFWIAAACWLTAGPEALPAPPKALTRQQELELQMFTGQLADPSRSAKTKAEAAELLLTRSYPQAAEALRKFLADASNRPAQIAVAEAIANSGSGAPTFVESLLTMLTGAEPSVRLPAARALATYKNQGVIGKLIVIAKDRKADKAVRLATIVGLQRVLDQQAVDALVYLVGEHDAVISNAAAEALAKLTNIRTFGASPGKWRRWWANSKNKPASEWLADLAESLGREKARLEDENAQLRQRLATAMTDCYNATAPAQRNNLLLTFLKDPLGDVRLVGVTLANKRASSNEPVPEELRTQVRTMLADEDPTIRRAAAGVEASLGDPNAVDLLLGRLEIEAISEVQVALLTALGRFGGPRTLGPILREVQSKDEAVAAAAAAALARGAVAQPPKGEVRDQAVDALLKRYGAISGGNNGAELREALLTAMGVVADKKLLPALRSGLKDAAATVRLAAVKGLAQLGGPGLGDMLAPLAGDGDRGVRQAVVDALGAWGGEKHLPTLLQRTDPAAEPDAAVREKAWSVAMAVLAKASAATLSEVFDSLAERKDAAARRIEVGQALVQALKADKSPELPQAQRKLAAMLMTASRPAEAAPLLGEALSLLLAAKSPEASKVYLEWIDALLKANDPMVIKAMADPHPPEAFGEVLARLSQRLAALLAEKRYAPVILLGGEAMRQLPQRLSDAQRQDLQRLLADATARQSVVDRERVSQLAAQLLAADATASKAAAGELKAMGDRAVQPLVMELKKVASGEKANEAAEKAILGVLTQIAPKLTGYDLKAPQGERLQKIDAWLKVL